MKQDVDIFTFFKFHYPVLAFSSHLFITLAFVSVGTFKKEWLGMQCKEIVQ